MKPTYKKIIKGFFFLFFLALLVLLALYSIKLLQKDKLASEKEQEESYHLTSKETITMTPSPTVTPSPTPIPMLSSLDGYEAGDIVDSTLLDMSDLDLYFTSKAIDTTILDFISGKSYRENPDITLEDLTYLKLLHYNYNHEIQVGELLINKQIATDCIEIFQELFKQQYEISSMYLIDRYWMGDGSSTDTASMSDNNSSGFCYRTIAGTSKLSNHALGFAIDINPYENPYITYKNGVPVFYHENAENYADRDLKLSHMIDHDDLCYQLFTQHGFTWGGDWKNSKDYQHFEKKIQ